MIYLDNASTTPVNKKIQELIFETMSEFGNPSNIYSLGQKTKQKIELAREQVANAIGAEPDEIYFTSGASESNSMALHQKDFCWCSPYEHHSILYNTKAWVCDDLEKSLIDLQTKVKKDLSLKRFANNLLVSNMLVNNETGQIFNIELIADLCDKIGILLHSDATQSIGKIRVNVKEQKIKILSLSGHKFYVPKGIGAIFIDKSIKNIKPLIFGGGQEKRIRGGTENVPYIVALGEGISQALNDMHESHFHHSELKHVFLGRLSRYKDLDWRLNSPENSIPSIINISFKNIEGEVLASMLADDEIYVGTGSACDTGNFDPSHVLKAMKVPDEYINGAIRISFGQNTTIEDVLVAVEKIVKNYKLLVR